MSKGYHSRSPEEFQEFLKKSREAGKSKNRSKLILFFDVILLLFIFAVVARLLNPLAFTGQTESKEVPWEELQLRVTSSREAGKDLPVFFLFAKNQGKVSREFPSKEESLSLKISAGDGLNCLSEVLHFSERRIEPGSTEYFRYSPDESKQAALPPECKVAQKSMWNNITKAFQKEKQRRMEMQVSKDRKSISLEIQNF